MANLWLKIKIWTKVAIASLIGLYVLAFVVKNGGRQAKFWYWYDHDYETSLLKLVFFAFLAGAIVTILLETTIRTISQIKQLRSRSRSAKLEQEVADMKMKAAMLQTRPATGPVSGPSPLDALPPIPPSPDREP
jgi:hypothetical protein